MVFNFDVRASEEHATCRRYICPVGLVQKHIGWENKASLDCLLSELRFCQK